MSGSAYCMTASGAAPKLAVSLVRDHPDGAAVAPARLGQLFGQARQGGCRVDPPRGIVRGIDDHGSGPWPQCGDDALDVQVEVRRLEPDANRNAPLTMIIAS